MTRGIRSVQLVHGGIGMPLAIDDLVAWPRVFNVHHRGFEHMVHGVAGLEFLKVQQAIHIQPGFFFQFAFGGAHRAFVAFDLAARQGPF